MKYNKIFHKKYIIQIFKKNTKVPIKNPNPVHDVLKYSRVNIY